VVLATRTGSVERRYTVEQVKGFFGKLFDLSFKDFVTPKIIKILFVIAMVVSCIAGLGIIGMGFSSGALAGVASIIVAPIAVVLYIIIARVWLELVLVIFSIEEHTRGSAPVKTDEKKD
jgi:hypothetical protein